MPWPGLKIWLVLLATLPALSSSGQSQSCPLNINFSSGILNHWEAYTGNNQGGNGPDAIKLRYDSGSYAPGGTIGASAIPEYDLPGVNGIRVITNQGTDDFGGFQTIPTINGYVYQYSVLLGSTSVTNHQTTDQQNGQTGAPVTSPQGGYVRGISYLINVPPGPPNLPYTMTYAYAMVLENGTHASQDQPMAQAIVSTPAGVIACASPAYFLPTDGGALDSATARANGFSPSPVPTPNASQNAGSSGQYLKDVWTKGWTEVTFDLTAYRGQQVSLTFEADNCVPGGHFAYAYFALRDACAGLQLSGATLVCANSVVNYSVPALDSATYQWSTPVGWAVGSGGNSNSISVTVGPQPGYVAVRETNTCASLTGSLLVNLYPGALPQAVIDPADTTVCFGEKAPLHAVVSTGTDYSWISQASFTGGSKGNLSSLPAAVDVVAGPQETADYILNIRNTGCPTTVSDTFKVTIVQPLRVSAGDDTLVVVGEPLHLQASSSDIYPDEYRWTPTANLSNPDIADPVALFESGMNSTSFMVTATDTFGCYGTATVNVTIATSPADIIVPNAFTPGGNSNSIFRPVCYGISSLDYFRVFNRWGQLLYSTSQIGQGWDGRAEGKLQEPNAYLWVAKGTDYTGRVISKRGTVVLVR
jgi:gliding motility-associated-like protein